MRLNVLEFSYSNCAAFLVFLRPYQFGIPKAAIQNKQLSLLLQRMPRLDEGAGCASRLDNDSGFG